MHWIWHCNSIVMPGCSPGPSPQQMYCNQSKPLSQNHRFDENWSFCDVFFHCRTLCSSLSMKIYQEWSTPWTVFTCSARGQIPCGCWDLRTWIVKLMKNCSFCDVLFTAEHFIQVVVQKHTRNCQLDEQCQRVWQGCRYHADVQSKGPESKIWWKTGRFVTFFTMPNIWFKS